MIFNSHHHEAYIWVWLPGATAPVVAGRMTRAGQSLVFNYGRSYLERQDAIPLYLPELPLRAGRIEPASGLTMAGCLRDGAPDAWGRRLIDNLIFGIEGKGANHNAVDEFSYLLESGSDRIGALDFQHSPTEYVPRIAKAATLEALMTSVQKVEKGIPLHREFDQALFHGSSVGGARPKVMIEDGNKKLIAKFPSISDTRNVVKAEFIAMRLAAIAGLSVAPVRLVQLAGKDVLLIERFDRVKINHGWQRKLMISALTMFALDEMVARYASYADLANIIRHRFTNPKTTLRELFARLVFNIICGNTDDHARNHAAFFDGSQLALTPAYDLCPQHRTGNEASQAMWITADNKSSTLKACMDTAPNFLQDRHEAKSIIEHLLEIVRTELDLLCEEADLAEVDRRLLQERIFLNPFIFEGSRHIVS
ncbi:MAG: type II toxin-antitoxin system HipA family toxin [Pseudomonadota bacterium]